MPAVRKEVMNVAEPLKDGETTEEQRIYQTPEIEVIRYEESDDVIMTSPDCDDTYSST